MKIEEITIDPQKSITGDPLRFRVGDAVELDNGHHGHVVTKINYNPVTRLFNKGLEIGQASYTVYFESTENRRIFPEHMITSIEAVRNKTTETNIPMPE